MGLQSILNWYDCTICLLLKINSKILIEAVHVMPTDTTEYSDLLQSDQMPCLLLMKQMAIFNCLVFANICHYVSKYYSEDGYVKQVPAELLIVPLRCFLPFFHYQLCSCIQRLKIHHIIAQYAQVLFALLRSLILHYTVICNATITYKNQLLSSKTI